MILSEPRERFTLNDNNSGPKTPEQQNALLSNSKQFTCKSDKLNLNFLVHVHNQTQMASQKCFILTIHDLGSNHSQFERFIRCEQMTGISNRAVWLSIDLPGQEPDAEDLKLRKYPSLEEIADELICVVDFLKIPQVVCMGEGAGANIAAYFAMKHPSRCLGVVLVEPIGSSASIMESIRYKLNHLNLINKTKSNLNEKGNFIFNKLDTSSSSEINVLNVDCDELSQKIFDNQNSKNLALFTEAFFNRSCLMNELSRLKVDTLVAVGKNSPMYAETKKIYRTLQELNKKTPQKMVNSPYLEIDNVCSILQESPDRLATSLQFFLQGIGLLSAMPMNKSLKSLAMLSSQTSFDRQSSDASSSSMDRRPSSSSQSQSQVSQSEESASQHASSTHSLCDNDL